MKKGHGFKESEVWQRFWKNVVLDKETKCWNWIGSVFPKSGRARIKIRNKTVLSSRQVMLWRHGHLPDGLLVCHHCDNILCVNPTHLFFGTAKDNVRDMHNKNRNADVRGVKNPMSVLNEDNVEEIKTLLAQGIKGVDIASKFNIGVMVVSRIKTGRSYL